MSQQVEPVEAAELHDHPSPRQYVWVAIVLAIITAAEVGIYYIGYFEENSVALIIFLLAFALLKFVMVAMWFMHLRFDSRVFRRFFVTGVVLGLIIFGIVLWTFFAHGGPAPAAG